MQRLPRRAGCVLKAPRVDARRRLCAASRRPVALLRGTGGVAQTFCSSSLHSERNPLQLPDSIFESQSCDFSAQDKEARPPCFFYSDWADMQLPANHRFPMDKYRQTRECIEDAKFARVAPGPLATVAEAGLAHDEDYVARVISGCMTTPERARVGFKEVAGEPGRHCRCDALLPFR
eukprot:TRINITY_DN50382_c0_g1_i1.p1 TRINITY_DN50382_c0_g1~~TRINITY_DN50382_c0_g1_i1.p1  ORF type:complete len:195 (-),score=14.07 TRINITY_DN50382_c0_g1_i1:405-935(-)